MKWPWGETPEQDLLREVHPTQILVSNAAGLLELQRITEAVKDLLKIETPEILMLQETKIEGETLLHISNSKWKKNAEKDISVGGTSGDLATLWSDDESSLESSFET